MFRTRSQGPAAETVLQRICANDIARPGRAIYTPMLNENGGFESDLTVIRLDTSAFLAVTGTAQTVRDCNWIARHIRENERATVADVTSGWSTLLLTSLRTEKAFRSWGHDIGPRDTPLEAGLEFAVAFSKGMPFTGKEALMRQRDRSLGRRLLGDPYAIDIATTSYTAIPYLSPPYDPRGKRMRT